MNSIQRRLGGLTLALIMVPVLIGVLACLPVPVGDPERSRIDPRLTGYWIMTGPEEINLVGFEPYDKRTWLVQMVDDVNGSGDIELPKDGWPWAYETLVSAIPRQTPRHEPSYYKAWRSRLGKQWYMTWEPKADKSWNHDFWHVFWLKDVGEGTFEAALVDPNENFFKGVEETRRAFEKVIRKNAENPEMFGFEQGEAIRGHVFYRIREEDWDHFKAAF